MIDLQTVLTYLTLISVPVGVFYHIMTLRNTRKTQVLTLKAQEQAKETRQAQLLMGLYEAYRNPDFRILVQEVINQEWTDFDDFWEKYGAATNPVAWSNWGSVAAFFNGIGVLLKKDLIDIAMVDELISNLAFVIWYRMEPIIEVARESIFRGKFGGEAASSRYEGYSGFEYLINELKKREREYTETNA